jgi:hypothetical protein
VDPPRRERSPRPLDFRSRDVRLAEERREPVEPVDHDMATTKSAAHRRERDAVLGIDGIDGGFNPDNVQEPVISPTIAADSKGPRDSGHHSRF